MGTLLHCSSSNGKLCVLVVHIDSNHLTLSYRIHRPRNDFMGEGKTLYNSSNYKLIFITSKLMEYFDARRKYIQSLMKYIIFFSSIFMNISIEMITRQQVKKRKRPKSNRIPDSIIYCWLLHSFVLYLTTFFS